MQERPGKTRLAMAARKNAENGRASPLRRVGTSKLGPQGLVNEIQCTPPAHLGAARLGCGGRGRRSNVVTQYSMAPLQAQAGWQAGLPAAQAVRCASAGHCSACDLRMRCVCGEPSLLRRPAPREQSPPQSRFPPQK